jgi:hypothetical protein
MDSKFDKLYEEILEARSKDTPLRAIRRSFKYQTSPYNELVNWAGRAIINLFKKKKQKQEKRTPTELYLLIHRYKRNINGYEIADILGYKPQPNLNDRQRDEWAQKVWTQMLTGLGKTIDHKKAKKIYKKILANMKKNRTLRQWFDTDLLHAVAKHITHHKHVWTTDDYDREHGKILLRRKENATPIDDTVLNDIVKRFKEDGVQGKTRDVELEYDPRYTKKHIIGMSDPDGEFFITVLDNRRIEVEVPPFDDFDLDRF